MHFGVVDAHNHVQHLVFRIAFDRRRDNDSFDILIEERCEGFQGLKLASALEHQVDLRLSPGGVIDIAALGVSDSSMVYREVS